MPQLNLHLTEEFEEALDELMRLRQIRTKSEAVRWAVLSAAERERRRRAPAEFSKWLGLGLREPENPHPRFRSDDDLWG
jgi:Arc/MetJ-type ribon-helix-helix transcriptional regulator